MCRGRLASLRSVSGKGRIARQGELQYSFELALVSKAARSLPTLRVTGANLRWRAAEGAGKRWRDVGRGYNLLGRFFGRHFLAGRRRCVLAAD